MGRQNKTATVSSVDEPCDKTGRCPTIDRCLANHICHLCTKLENSFRNRWVECSKCRVSICFQKIPGQKKGHHTSMMDKLWEMVQLPNWSFHCLTCVGTCVSPATIAAEQQQQNPTTMSSAAIAAEQQKPTTLSPKTSPVDKEQQQKLNPPVSSSPVTLQQHQQKSAIHVEEQQKQKLKPPMSSSPIALQQQKLIIPAEVHQQEQKSTMPSSPDASQLKRKSTISTEVAEIRRMISALSREVAGLRTSVCPKTHSEGSYRSALLSNLPVARTEPQRIEGVAEPATHELIAIGVPEDVVDLQAFIGNTAWDLSCVPPKSASRLGRPGSKPRLIRLLFTGFTEARTFHLAADRARRDNIINFRTQYHTLLAEKKFLTSDVLPMFLLTFINQRKTIYL
ncbi:Hypothetical predicted protein [Octopus vulgaris]|uniref:Uncharacterized protein n=1 Tax=Octopus vulgaris TaxID=6645 RepID=A0AA36FLY6_OCTVU|nr:Hypothetical predicted protein [Octopus vulgaris]